MHHYLWIAGTESKQPSVGSLTVTTDSDRILTATVFSVKAQLVCVLYWDEKTNTLHLLKSNTY